MIERLGPEMGAALGVDQLCVDADPPVGRLHRSFQRIAQPEIPARLLQSVGLPL